jgi:hypothetical protein
LDAGSLGSEFDVVHHRAVLRLVGRSAGLAGGGRGVVGRSSGLDDT